MTQVVPIDGLCPEVLAPVRDAFVENFATRGEVGAAVCVLIDGEVVVNLVGGWRDAERTMPWRPNTLVDIYSAGKGLLSVLALKLIDEGSISLDQRIETMWPEYGCAGKETTLVRHALSHTAGVPALREPMTNADLWSWDRMTGALANTQPWSEPGARLVYHVNTFGHLVGEIVRRGGGHSVADSLRALVEPIGADAWYALPATQQERCADVLFDTPPALRESVSSWMTSPDLDQQMVALAYINPPGYGSSGVVNTQQWRGAEIPAANAHATAEGLARIYAELLSGRLISSDLLAEATTVQASGDCPILGEHVEYGLGFIPTSVRRPLGTGSHGFGHFGTGGAVGFADPDRGLAFGYVMNHVVPRWQSTRNRALIDSLYRCL